MYGRFAMWLSGCGFYLYSLQADEKDGWRLQERPEKDMRVKFPKAKHGSSDAMTSTAYFRYFDEPAASSFVLDFHQVVDIAVHSKPSALL
jgi:hypothetical protein